jgi:hypothetical protein
LLALRACHIERSVPIKVAISPQRQSKISEGLLREHEALGQLPPSKARFMRMVRIEQQADAVSKVPAIDASAMARAIENDVLIQVGQPRMAKVLAHELTHVPELGELRAYNAKRGAFVQGSRANRRAIAFKAGTEDRAAFQEYRVHGLLGDRPAHLQLGGTSSAADENIYRPGRISHAVVDGYLTGISERLRASPRYLKGSDTERARLDGRIDAYLRGYRQALERISAQQVTTRRQWQPAPGESAEERNFLQRIGDFVQDRKWAAQDKVRALRASFETLPAGLSAEELERVGERDGYALINPTARAKKL